MTEGKARSVRQVTIQLIVQTRVHVTYVCDRDELDGAGARGEGQNGTLGLRGLWDCGGVGGEGLVGMVGVVADRPLS